MGTAGQFQLSRREYKFFFCPFIQISSILCIIYVEPFSFIFCLTEARLFTVPQLLQLRQVYKNKFFDKLLEWQFLLRWCCWCLSVSKIAGAKQHAITV